MNTYQKVAALVIRLVSLGLILYSCVAGVSMLFLMPRAIWMVLPTLAAGVVLFGSAIPIGKFVAGDIE